MPMAGPVVACCDSTSDLTRPEVASSHVRCHYHHAYHYAAEITGYTTTAGVRHPTFASCCDKHQCNVLAVSP